MRNRILWGGGTILGLWLFVYIVGTCFTLKPTPGVLATGSVAMLLSMALAIYCGIKAGGD